MLLTMFSLIMLALATIVVVLANIGFGEERKGLSDGAHRRICLAVFAAGCFLRLFQLGTLPGGISAEEALVGVQAKALWQTGGFLFDGGLTTQLAQWSGESTGPLLATLTAPFVGLFGMNAWTVRLPLALLSCLAMPAAYALGDQAGGKRAARWLLIIYALCPYFVLSARLTCGANAAVFLLPAALALLLRGCEKPACAYAGAALMGLIAYAQNMYFFIAPLAIAAYAVFAVCAGMKKRHALGAAALGLVICVPAMMTLWVNLTDAEGFVWLNMVRIPKLENFDKADCLLDTLDPARPADGVRNKIWAVITGGVFQILEHMNISPDMYAPAGMGALYVISLPLMGLGALSLAHGVLEGRKSPYRVKRAYLTVVFVCTLIMLVLYGSVGALDLTGCTDVFDYSALLLFDALLMTAGLCRMEKKSRLYTGALGVLMCACTAALCVHLLGGSYAGQANVYFHGFAEACVKADAIQEEKGARVGITSTVYPHITPSDAAEIMYLYAIDADTTNLNEQRNAAYEMIYAPGMENPDPSCAYIVTQDDVSAWDLTRFQYEEIGDYVLLSPL